VPVTELTENFSPMLRIAPPPFGKLTEGNGFLAFRLPPSSAVCACEVLLVWPAWPDKAAPNGAGIGRESIELCPTHEICFAVNEEQYFAKYKPQTSSAACGIAMVFAHSQSTYTTTRPSTWHSNTRRPLCTWDCLVSLRSQSRNVPLLTRSRLCHKFHKCNHSAS
jgi:hypothetical protein